MATLVGSKRRAADAPATASEERPLTKKQLRKLRKQTPAEKLQIQYRLKIVSCVKEGDAAAALEAYAQMKAEVAVPAYVYPMVLNVCCNHEQSAMFQQGAFEVFHDMKRAATATNSTKGSRGGASVDETVYSALVKLCSRAKDLAAAEELLAEMEVTGTAPKLRTFAPLLEAYSAAGDLSKCEAVMAKMSGYSIPATEAEHVSMLSVCEKSADAGKFYAYLDQFIEDIPQPGGAAWAVLQRWFNSEAAKVDGRGWMIEEETVDANGVCSPSGDRLASMELSEAATTELLDKIETLVRTDDRRIRQWDEFKAWLDASGPFGVVIDAANVGYFNQNFDGGGFSYEQIEAMVEHYQMQGKKVLVVLHKRRTLDEQVPPEYRKTVAAWAAAGVMYNCQPGNNDDWYWLYAAAKLGGRTLLVSNDEMRDHHFQMIHNRSFARWKERHQVHYSAWGRRVQVREPAPYSSRPQRVGQAWHFPVLLSSAPADEVEAEDPPAKGATKEDTTEEDAPKREVLPLPPSSACSPQWFRVELAPASDVSHA